MQGSFQARRGGYRRDEGPHLPRAAAHLWPFSRALVATLDLAGIDAASREEIDVESAIEDLLRALERYWDASREPPAYSSDVRGSRVGGDRYYDDNAWIGLGLVQLERMRPGSGHLDRAEELFRFAVSGWSSDREPSPGGVFWVEQGRGTGRTNHDRNTVSNAPNAELGLHVAELKGGGGERGIDAGGLIGPRDMYEWVLSTLDASKGTDAAGTGLFWDKVRSDGTIDWAFWSYNQGSLVGLNVLLARSGATDRAEHLGRAEAIARKALRHYAGRYEAQPPAFNAIFFRNLLLLHAASDDAELRDEIVQAIRDYVDRAWEQWRDRRDRFRLPQGGATLLNQSAFVQLLALLAWDPEEYGRLA
jgi:hypothetical protein